MANCMALHDKLDEVSKELEETKKELEEANLLLDQYEQAWETQIFNFTKTDFFVYMKFWSIALSVPKYSHQEPVKRSKAQKRRDTKIRAKLRAMGEDIWSYYHQ